MPIQKIGITSKPKKPEIRKIVPPLMQWLRERKIEVFIDRETAATLEVSDKCSTRNEIPTQVELIVVL